MRRLLRLLTSLGRLVADKVRKGTLTFEGGWSSGGP